MIGRPFRVAELDVRLKSFMNHPFRILLFGAFVSTALASDPFDMPSIEPLELPPVPSMIDVAPVKDPKSATNQNNTQSNIQEPEGRPFVGPDKPRVLYQRKKSGYGQFTISAASDSLVKIIDIETRRLEALLWIPGGTRYIHHHVSASDYLFIYGEGIIMYEDGSIALSWIGRTQDTIQLRDNRFEIELSINAKSPQIFPATIEDFNQFSTPK
jgi:hypothetical protein